MLIHWQSHQEYLNFLHETKVHLDSSQRTRLRLEFGPVREKLRLLDLDPVMEYLSAFYSATGRPAKNQVQIIRSLILMVMLGFTSLTAWLLKLKADSLLAALAGCPPNPLPPLGSYFDLMDRLWEQLTQADVHLAAGLHLTWVRRQREDFRAYLMKSPCMDFRFNGTDYHINVVGCSIYPQGYPAVVEHLADFKGTNLLADIGNGTMNILYISSKKPVENRSYTEKCGVNQCMIAARNAVLDSFGVKIEDSIIEQILRSGTADIGSTYLECIERTAAEYISNIFATLRRYEYNPDLMRLYVVGGSVKQIMKKSNLFP